MKFLELDQQTEQQLIAVFDAALKHQGFQMQGLVQQLIAKVKDHPKPQEAKVE